MGFKFTTPKIDSIKSQSGTSIKKNVAKWQWYIIFILILSPLIFFIWTIFADYWFVSANGYIKIDKYDIKAPDDAYIKSINVISGDKVIQGQMLVQLESPIINSRIKELKLQLEQLEPLQKMLKNREKVDLVKMLIESHKYLDKMAGEYDKFEQYLDEGIITLLEFRAIQQTYFQAQLQYYDIQKMISESEISILIEDESNFSKDIRDINAELAMLNERLKTLIIRSSGSGNIIDIFANNSEFITKGQTIMSLTYNSPPYIKAYLDPKYLYMVSKGDQVEIKFPDNKKILGKILYQPAFSQVDDTTLNTFSNKESKIILIIKPNNQIAENYLIYNSPVTVYFN